MAAPLILASQARSLVQVASAWPTSDAGWTEVDMWAKVCSVGSNNDVGKASLFTPAGKLMKPMTTSTVLVKSQSLCGQYVRVLRRDQAGGTVMSSDGLLFSPLWTGIINERSMAPDGANLGFVNTYECSGILSVLDSVTPEYHLHETDGEVAADIGHAPIFNYLGSKKTRNRSADKFDFGGGVMAYVFSRATTAEFWTAADLVEYYLALFKYFSNGFGPTFTVAGQTDALAWQEKWDLNGHSCLEALTRVMASKQGIGFRVNSAGTDPVITVKSLATEAITVPATAFTPSFVLPANDEQISLDLTASNEIQGFALKESALSAVDELCIEMARTWYVGTLSLFDDFDIDWAPADQAIIDAGTFDPLDTYGTLNTNFGLARVYRRFKLKADWSGTLQGGFVLPNGRVKAAGSLYGAGAFTGAGDDSGVRPPGPCFLMTSELPCLDGYDWSTVDPATVDKTRRNAPAMAFAENVDGTWSTLGEASSGGLTNLSIEVDGDLGCVTLPNESIETVRTAIEEGLKIYITVGIYGQFSDIVAWKRAQASQPRDQTRTMVKQRPNLTRKVIPIESVVGVAPTGTLLRNAAEIVIHDDTGLAGNLLALSRTWVENNAWSISFDKIGEIDPAYALPGSIITAVTHFEGDGSTAVEATQAVITSVEYDLNEPGTTRVTARRIEFDVEAVI